MKPTYEELMEDNTRGALYVERLKARIENLEHEIVRLRAIFPEVLSRLGSGACAPDCSIEFLLQIPNEVGLVVDELKRETSTLRNDKADAIRALTDLRQELLKFMQDHAKGALYVEHLKARIEELEKIVSSCLRELPVGYVPAHTPESLPDRIAYYVQQVTELKTDNAKLRKTLASSCDEERSMGIEEGPHHATCGLAQGLNARIEELEAHVLRLIETGGILADVSTEYRRKLWVEAVREVVK